MPKIKRGPGADLMPVPTVLVTCRRKDEIPNIITIAWTGIMCNKPTMVYIGVQPIRYSHPIIKETGEFVINIPPARMVKTVDYCGVVSGRDVDKFKETGLTPVPGEYVGAPLIKECPVNLECQVKDVLSLGTHDVFIAEVLAVHYNEDVLKENGRPDLDKIKTFSYCQGEYRAIAEEIGHYGYSKK